MSTKVTILGQKKEEAEKVLKPIEFCKYLRHLHLDISKELDYEPKDFKFIELICKGYDAYETLDLMLAYDNPSERYNSFLVLGHFNDGVVD